MAILAVGTETIPTDLVVGQGFTYVIHVVNLGPDRAANVVLTDLLDETVEPGDLDAGCSRQGRVVMCTLGVIEPGAQKVVGVRATPTTPAGPLINAASAQGTNTNVTTVLHLAFARRPPNLVQFFMPR